MTRTRPVQNTWSSGEIDPALQSRSDFQRYQTGLKRCLGFTPLRQGGITRAPGTIYRGTTKNNQVQRRIPFIFAANDAVELEFTNLTMRVWRYGALVMNGGSPYELTTPYAEAHLAGMAYAQDGDTMLLLGGGQPMQQLSRNALDDWEIEPAELKNGPYRVQNLDVWKEVRSSTITGASNYFKALEQINVNDLRRVGDMVYRLTNATVNGSPVGTIDLGQEAPSHTTGSAVISWTAGGDNKTATWAVSALPAGGEVTLYGGGNVFEPDHVGSLLRLEPTDYEEIPNWTENTPATPGDLFRYDGNIYRLTKSINTGLTPPTHTFGTQQTFKATDTRFKFLSDSTGVVRITAVVDQNEAQATVLKEIPQPIINGETYRWSEGAWSELYGYPSRLALHGAQLVSANSDDQPRTIWASTDQAILDYEPSAEADGSFAYTIRSGGTKDEVIWLLSGSRGLYLGTLGEVILMFSTDPGKGLGPATVDTELVSSGGVADALPVAPYGFPLFISRDRQKILEGRYRFESEGYEPIELSLPSQHLGAASFAQILWRSAPDKEAWVRCEDGSLVLGLYEPQQDVLGWAPITVAGGFVEDMCMTPDANGAYDVLTLVVRRQVNGQTVRYVEEQAINRAPMLGAVPISHFNHGFATLVFEPGSPTDTFSLPHLEGESVFAWTDKGHFGPLTAAAEGGNVILPEDVTRAVIGLMDDTHQAETLNIVAQGRDGDTRGRKRRLNKETGVELFQTAGGTMRAVEEDFDQPIRLGAKRELVERGIALNATTGVSGTRRLETPSGYAHQQRLRLEPLGLAPMTLTALIPDIDEEAA